MSVPVTAMRNAAVPHLMYFGVAPLLAAGTTLLSGACMGVAAALVLCASAGSLAICRRLAPPAMSLVFLLLLTATWTSIVDLALQSLAFPLRQGLGVYVPLIAANCLILSTLDEHVLREGGRAAFAHACTVGAWIVFAVTAVGAAREWSATGILFGDAALFGFESTAASPGFAIMRAPAGAFLALGLLAALLHAFRPRRAAA